jgi:hypothetical protein
MIGKDVVLPLTLPPGDTYRLCHLLLPTKPTRTHLPRARVGIVGNDSEPITALDHLFPRPELQPVVEPIVHRVHLT